MFISILALSSCTDPAKEFAVETAQCDSLSTQLAQLSQWFVVDETKIRKRQLLFGKQNKLIQTDSLDQFLPHELGLSVIQYRGIPAIYNNYLLNHLAISKQQDSLVKAVSLLKQDLYDKKIGRRKFRDLLAGLQHAVGNLEMDVNATSKKVFEVEPTYKRIQPHIDSLDKLMLVMPGQ